MSIRTLEAEDLKRIHAYLTEQEGGNPDVCNEWVLDGLKNIFSGDTEDFTWGSAAMMHLAYICHTQPFYDKNEQVALMAAEVFLRMHDKEMGLTDDEAVKLVRDVSARRLNGQELLTALKGKVYQIEED